MHQSSGSNTSPIASKPKEAIPIFLVDDHAVVREGIRRLLELDGDVVIVGEADSAEEALNQLRFCAPKVVLMDIRLPGISGIEATRHIKAQHPDLRVLILSAFGDEHLAQAIEAGADGYVLKTTKRAELMEAVRRAAQGHALIDQDLTGNLLNQFAKLFKNSQVQGLKQRQLVILKRVSEGASSKKIAVELSISDATFKRDMRRIFDHFGVNDRAQAVAEAYKRSLL